VDIPIVSQDLSKSYGEGPGKVNAVIEANLTFNQGEIVALFGPSGSGKTTLLSLFGCLLRPTKGSLFLFGESIHDKRETEFSKLRKKYVSFIFQGFNLFPALTVFENVMLGLFVKHIRGKTAEAQANLIIEQVGLADRKNFLPRDLSGGQKQRVSVARAIATESPIILADEPTANLDVKNGRKIIQMLHKLAKKQNKCIIVATHDTRMWNAFDRILLMQDGRIVKQFTRES
jgi:putative ABC transport system ATP-binding protein